MFHLPIAGSKFQPSRPVANVEPGLDRADLRIRNLLDDPRLRSAMGLDTSISELRQPERRFDRRRLLEGAAA